MNKATSQKENNNTKKFEGTKTGMHKLIKHKHSIETIMKPTLIKKK